MLVLINYLFIYIPLVILFSHLKQQWPFRYSETDACRVRDGGEDNNGDGEYDDRVWNKDGEFEAVKATDLLQCSLHSMDIFILLFILLACGFFFLFFTHFGFRSKNGIFIPFYPLHLFLFCVDFYVFFWWGLMLGILWVLWFFMEWVLSLMMGFCGLWDLCC